MLFLDIVSFYESDHFKFIAFFILEKPGVIKKELKEKHFVFGVKAAIVLTVVCHPEFFCQIK